MRLARFSHDGRERGGVVVGDEVVDLPAAAPELPDDPVALLAAGPDALAAAEAATGSGPRYALDEVALRNPVPRPHNFLAIGLNYADHIAESGMPTPEHPVFFNKEVSCVTGPFDPIHLPRASTMVDYEGELGFVIGRRCRHVPAPRAHEVIAGYFVANDVTARDWQFRTPQWNLGKSFDTHGPIGPWIVTADEVGDPHDLDLETWVNGERRQASNTRNLVFDCFEQVETLSTVCTLEPGDLVASGTPDGVGMAMDPPGFLADGDVVTVTISGIGTIANPVIVEPDDTALI
ncbi:MAG: fumarylacetoacetate hydrolase family protein [Acidimicrobiales bacterium]|nr:fumarylacetoacetate hydrolase family protein [Acidimicrobiales bacterium]